MIIEATVAPQTNEQAFLSFVSKYRTRLAIELGLLRNREKFMTLLQDACNYVLKLAQENTLNCTMNDGMLAFNTHGRSLAMVPAVGVASDVRLHNPLGQYCAQVLIFACLDDHTDSELLGTVRIYEDGLCTDGDLQWRLEDGSTAFIPYVLRLVGEHLLECETYWPSEEELPMFIQSVAVIGKQIDTEPLKKSCVGFECSLNNRHKRR